MRVLRRANSQRSPKTKQVNCLMETEVASKRPASVSTRVNPWFHPMLDNP
jgi:hypothetical protein